MPPVDDKVADIRDPRERVGEDEDGVPLAQGIDQKQEGAGKAQPPERDGHDDTLQLLGRIPLHEEARKEHRVPDPADNLPDAPIDSEKLAVVPNQIAEPVQGGRLHREV